MAKWGEGDPRWEVEEREDGRNLNDWHWVEKSIVPWAEKELKKRFASLVIYDGPLGLFTFDGLKKLDGTICAHVRRGRRFVLYDFNVSFDFKGNLAGVKETAKGVVKIPYMGDENDFDDFEFEITVESGSDKSKAKQIVHRECKKVLRQSIKSFMEFMNEEWTKGPLRSDAQTEVKQMKLEEDRSAKPPSDQHSKEIVTKDSGPGKNLSQKVTLNGPVEMIFQTFLDKDRLSAFTQSEAKIDPRVGGSFSLFSGNVHGIFSEIVPMKTISQKWRFNDWKDGYYSTVILSFESHSGRTTIQLTQKNIPVNDLDRTKEGWNRFYWNNFRNMFGGNIGSFV
eukprot:CAMPEP_0201484130 /NCGR_PEP_ID=MMETSP0151_2-20130828/8331_1 /ASSEMBLY_ACC=CAM_ASM_000257 /TAXON_ID=200890 /ORGANISM="Paramoeba atlantica, Strain 621/1 / CCAP 1560/9" /LENGTH=337 /DNA_ID=CAMNT_0047867647 /DNA_START=39 /DNA_END=1052 /DNA_ORIENTATION=+